MKPEGGSTETLFHQNHSKYVSIYIVFLLILFIMNFVYFWRVNWENEIHRVFLLKSERSWNFVFIYDKAVIKDPLEEEKKGDS